jgi:hypothetical protein
MYPHVRQLTTRCPQLDDAPARRAENRADRRLTRARAWLLAAAMVGTVAGVTVAATSAEAAAERIDSAAGANAAAIQSTVDDFRARLGVLNPSNGLSFPSGRREVNWDGVPDNRSAPNPLPPDFFNTTSPRGLVLSGAPVFSVSADQVNPTATPVRFGELDPGYPAQLAMFSPQRLFAAPGSHTMDITFRIPGTQTAASVAAFGSVFTDVENVGASGITLYDEHGHQLADVRAPVHGGGLSFIGYSVDDGRRIARVRITTGTDGVTAGLADAPPVDDIVALDDFIYAEPKAIPPAPAEPPAPADPPAPPPAEPAPDQPSAATDRTAPQIAGLRLRRHGRAVGYRLSEPARVTLTLHRRGNTRVRLTRDGLAGRNTVKLPRLPRGRYRLRAIARDAAGNTSPPARLPIKTINQGTSRRR